MDAIERAIRTAFEKGNADDRAFREKVYRQAFAALDRAMQAHPNLTVETAIARRKALQDKIASIETEFLPAGPAAAPAVEVRAPASRSTGPAAPAPSVDAPVSGAAGPVAAPSVEPDLGAVTGAPDRRVAEPTLPSIDAGERAGSSRARASEPASAEVAPDRDDARANERRRPYAAMFFAVTILAAIAIGGWWTYQTGLLLSPEERDTSVPNPPQMLEEEDFTPEEEAAVTQPGGLAPAADDRDWITVFSPSDPTQVSAPADAEAAVGQDESGSFIRIRTGASGEPVVFDVGQGILEQIAGKSAVFDIVARAEEGQETQISVACDFGGLGDCGRRRYVVGYERAEYLFEVALPAGEPAAAGSISVDSDFADEGKAVDIYEIRVAITE